MTDLINERKIIMSGTSYSYTSSREDRTETMVNNSAAAAKAGAAIVAGTAMVTAAAAGLLVVGAVKAVKAIGKLSVEAYKKYKVHEAEKQLAYHQLYLRGQEILKKKKQDAAKISAYKKELHNSVSGFAPSSKDVSSEVSDAVKRIEALESSLQRDSKTAEEKMLADMRNIRLESENGAKTVEEKTAEEMQRKTQDILSDWEEMSRKIVDNYADKQSVQLSSIKSEITGKYNSLNSKIDALHTGTAAKEKAMEQLARLAITDAEAVICHLADRQGAAERTSDIKLLAANLKNSKQMFNIGHYASAYSQAHNVTLNALDIISDISVEEAKRRNALNALTMQLAQLNEEIMVNEVYFDYDNKRYKDNLRDYAKRGFSTAMKKLDCLWARIHDDITLAEIAEIRHDAGILQKNFRSVYNLAFNRMISAYYTRDTAVLIKNAFEAQGLEFDDAAYEGDNKGEKLHINFKTKKNETVTVVVDHDADGEPYIDIHHYSGRPDALPDHALELSLNKTIQNVTGVKMHCVKPGKFSDSDDCDLDKAKKKAVV